MLLTIANILYVLVAAAMIILILIQRGAGANAGSGFGAGASATVFGARGSANFLSKSTAVLATLFFAISLGMAIYASHRSNAAPSGEDLGVMGAMEEVPTAPVSEVPASDVPAVSGAEVPAPVTSAPASETPAETAGELEKETKN